MRYKLLRDLPNVKAGLVFWRNDKGGFDFDPLPEDSYIIGEYLLGCVLDNSDWFEPLPEEPKRWRATPNESYWLVRADSAVLGLEELGEADDDLYKIGNYFRTKEQAQAVAEAFKAMLAYVHADTNLDSKRYEYVKAVNKAWGIVQKPTKP